MSPQRAADDYKGIRERHAELYPESIPEPQQPQQQAQAQPCASDILHVLRRCAHSCAPGDDWFAASVAGHLGCRCGGDSPNRRCFHDITWDCAEAGKCLAQEPR